MAMYAGKAGRPIDRTAMIEAASRSLRQQMMREANQRTRDRPRSKGSIQHQRSSSIFASHSSAARFGDLDANLSGTSDNGNTSGGGDTTYENGEPCTGENAQRRIRSAENEHRIIHAASREEPHVVSSPSSALDNYAADEEVQQAHPGLEDVANLGDLKRPLSRKKDPSASAAAGLGAFSSPVKMTDAFEQRKYRQPIPVESWGPRPPSRHGLPPKATGFEASLEHESQIVSTSSRSRGDGTSVVGGTWAAARQTPAHETRRGRERKAKDRSTPGPGPEDLGIFGSGARSPNGQQLSKSFSGVFDHSSESMPRPVPLAYAPSTFSPSLGSWASHVDTSGASGLEVSGCGLGDAGPAAPWPSSPAGSCAGSPPTRKGARHSETVSVEDVEADMDLSMHINSLRRDTTPPQVIVTRSTGQKRAGQGSRRGRENRENAMRELREPPRAPFSTSLDHDFLSLFAT